MEKWGGTRTSGLKEKETMKREEWIAKEQKEWMTGDLKRKSGLVAREQERVNGEGEDEELRVNCKGTRKVSG